jgi:hypothetical protein
MAVKQERPIQVQCPTPESEAQAGTTKLKREMQMGVTARRGEKPEIFTYTREDK